MKFLNSFTGEWVEPKEWQLALKAGDYYAIYPARIAPVFELAPVAGVSADGVLRFGLPAVGCQN